MLYFLLLILLVISTRRLYIDGRNTPYTSLKVLAFIVGIMTTWLVMLLYNMYNFEIY